MVLCALGALLVTGCVHRGGSAPSTATSAPSSTNESTHADREFSERVQKYAKLRQRMEALLPSLKSTNDVASIVDHQKALAKKIYDARRDAKQGDIFAPDVTAQFRQRLASLFNGPQSPSAGATIKQGEPVKALSLQVDNTYPDGVPITTVPLTLLQRLPPLPAELEYRVVGRYLTLHDMKANLIVDFIEAAIPVKASK